MARSGRSRRVGAGAGGKGNTGYTLETLCFLDRVGRIPLLRWDHFFLGSLDPSCRLQFDSVRIDQVLQRLAGTTLRHGIGGVAVPVDPYDFCDLAPLVRLAQAHYVYHESLFVGCAQFNKALV